MSIYLAIPQVGR
jgi:hypothetical protein